MRGAAAIGALLVAACSGRLDDRCGADADCGAGVCRAVEGVKLCVAPRVAIAIEGPGLVGRTSRVPLRIEGDAVALVAHATLDGVPLPDPRVDGAAIALDLPAGGDEAALHLTVEARGTAVRAERDLVADLAAPGVLVTPPGWLVRGRPGELHVAVEELHGPASLEIALVEVDVRAPEDPAAWSAVELIDGAGTATLDLSTVPLRAISGTAWAYLRVRDAAGNQAVTREALPVTRLLLDTTLPAAVARSGPVQLADGALLVPLEGPPWLVRIDPTTREVSEVAGAPPFPASGIAAGADVAVLAAGPAVVLLDAALAEAGRCERPGDPVVGAPVAGSAGGTALAVAATASGLWLSFRAGGAGGCTAVEGPRLGGIHAAARQAPALEILAAGADPGLIVLAVSGDGSLAAGRSGAGPLTHLPVASDGASVFAAEGDLAVAFDLAEGGAGPVPLRSAQLPAAATASAVVAAGAVLVPTAAGVAALPRAGQWDTPRALELGAPVASTPAIGADGTIWVVAGEVLHALALEGGAPVKVWSAPLAGGSDRPLSLGCDGVLAIAGADRLRLAQMDAGPDRDAPWGQQQHDPGRTGNAGAAYCASR